MQKLEIFELDSNQAAAFAADVAWARKKGANIEFFSRAAQPLAFTRQTAVRELLEREGVAALPAIVCDNVLVLNGRYPERAEFAVWLGLDAASAAQHCCGECC